MRTDPQDIAKRTREANDRRLTALQRLMTDEKMHQPLPLDILKSIRRAVCPSASRAGAAGCRVD
jgi:hypothetical protein